MSTLYIPNSLILGVPALDTEHRELVEKLDCCFSRVNNDGIRSRSFSADLEEFLDMIALHFQHEEVLMRRYDYEYIERHIASHQNILVLLNHLRCQTSIMTKDEVVFCFSQVINDIIYSDMSFANHLEIINQK